MRVLHPGSSGSDVRQVQHFLLGLGLYAGEVDGFYGSRTTLSVREYQKQEGMKPADGIVGRRTLAAMIADGLPVLAEPEHDVPLEPPGLRPPRTNEDRHRRWGRIRWEDAPEPGNPEAIRITNGFEEEHILRVDCPIWGPKKVRLHRAVVEHYLQFMEAIRAKGLRDRLLTYDGGFVPRYIRGSRSILSNHAWGTAFDINAAWNPLGRTPPFVGEKGCVREIVEIGAALGWYWGGWMSRRDGMHFEHC